MNLVNKYFMLVAAFAALPAFIGPLAAQEQSDHEGHDMAAMGHDMAAMMSVGEGGSWSYVGRNNPKMQMHERWEMVPVAARRGVAISATGMTREERCAALMTAQNIMLDRATRAACGGARQPAIPEEKREPSQHHDMDHNDGGHNH